MSGMGIERAARLGLLTAMTLWLAGCGSGWLAPVDSRDGYGPAPPGYYRVRRGDTLSEIAERRHLRLRTLAQWNRLGPPYPIYAGQLLRVAPPDGRDLAGGDRRGAGGGKASSGRARAVKTVATQSKPPGSLGPASGVTWQWPIRGPVEQTFRPGDRTRQGIRIAAAEGAPVGAAAAGVVVYSGSGLKGYGNLIIVKHSSRYLSAYGFNRRLLVDEGDRVERGQHLAEVGQAANGEHLLHFEIRRDGSAVDPLQYLPRTR